MTQTADPDLIAQGRASWGTLEPLHVIGYFAPQVTQEYVDLGLHPRLSYFAARSAALGAVDPAVTVATFYVFAPWLAHKALPESWQIASPARIQQARRTGVAKALDEALGEVDVSEALELARIACDGLTRPGRPLYAAHSALDWPEDDLLALWHAATLLREHRGDGHVAVLQYAQLDPVEALVLDSDFSGNADFLRATRGWTNEEWDAARQRLAERGLLAGDRLSDTGRELRQAVEDETDALAAEGWAHLGLEGGRRIQELLAPLRAQLLGGGMLPDWIARRG